MRTLGDHAKLDDVTGLFTGAWPQGLNKAGLKVHPEQGLVGYTLVTHASLLDERTDFTRQLRVDRQRIVIVVAKGHKAIPMLLVRKPRFLESLGERSRGITQDRRG